MLTKTVMGAEHSIQGEVERTGGQCPAQYALDLTLVFLLSFRVRSHNLQMS